MKLAVLCSGNLGFEILRHINSKSLDVTCVLTDKKSEQIIQYANNNNIPTFNGNPRNGRAFAQLGHLKVEVLLSVNYLYLIEKDLIDWPTVIAVNIHGSLLPKYRGRTPHVWAIINGEDKAGITLHQIATGCDTGAVINQMEIPILPEMTGAELLKLYYDNYPKLIDRFFKNLADSKIIKTNQDESKATYFGKRTPDSGMIDWNWSRHRISNWIRAQAYPYPGAFTYLNDHKIIIDKVGLSDHGFEYDMPNGLILSKDPITIKCPDGALQILDLRDDDVAILLKEKKVFNG